MAAWISTGTLSHKDQPSQRSSRAAVRALDRKVPARANAGMTERPIRQRTDAGSCGARPVWAACLRMVGRQREIPHAASDRTGTADVSAGPAAGTFRERPGRGLAVFGTALDSRRGLRRRPGVRAAGAARRGDDGNRSRGREHRGRPPARRRPGPRHRLSRRAHRGPGGGRPLVRCRHLPGGGGARAGRGRISQDLRCAWCGPAG